MFSNSRFLLTGASGFVGSHMLRHLLVNTDSDIVCPVTFRHRGVSDRIRLSMEGIKGAEGRVHVIKCDLTAPISKVTDNAFGPIDFVLNFASESHVDRSIDRPGEFIQHNVSLITNLLDWVMSRGWSNSPIRACVHISTDEVYGPADPGIDYAEWQALHLPSNPYAASKAAQESVLFSYWRTYDLPLMITNTMNIVGEMQDPEKFVPLVLRSVLQGAEVPIHSSTSSGVIGSRSYLHARNQADGVLHALRWVLDNPRGPRGRDRESLCYSDDGTRPYRFHITGEREVDNFQMARLIAKSAGKELRYKFVDFHSSRPGHDLRYSLNGAKMGVLGWYPPVRLDESIQRLVDWTMAHPEWLL